MQIPGDDALEREVVQQLRAFAELTSDFVGVADPWGRVLYLNPAGCKRLGVADAAGLTLADIFPVESFAFYYEVARPQLVATGAWSGEVLVKAGAAEATPMYLSVTAKVGPGGETLGGVVVARELIRPVAHAAASEAGDDGGVLTPEAFRVAAAGMLEAARHAREGCALVVVDVVGLREVNDVHGDFIAGNVLRALVRRLTRLTRTSDAVGCLDAHTLALLVRGVRSHGDALHIARIVDDALAEPVTTAAGSITVAVDRGLAFTAGDTVDVAALVDRARCDRIVPSARGSASAEFRAGAGRSTVSIDVVQVAMASGHIMPFARTVVDLATGETLGLRGTAHLDDGVRTVGADELATVLSDAPVASVIDLYVLRETAAAIALTARARPLRLYASVSRRLVADPRAESRLAEIADAFAIPIELVHLEVAPGLRADTSTMVADGLAGLREMGMALVAGDVTDPAEVAACAQRGFAELHILATAHELAERFVRPAHDAGLGVVATGVDTHELRRLAGLAGCDGAYGDALGPAVRADLIE